MSRHHADPRAIMWHPEFPGLGVLSGEVGHAVGWRLALECGVAAVVIVVMQPGRVGRCAVGL